MHALGESRYIASTQKVIWQYQSDIYFCGVLNVAAFYFSLNCIKNRFSFSTKWGDILIGRSKCVLRVNKEVINYDYEAYKSEEKERRKTNENQFEFQEPITENKN